MGEENTTSKAKDQSKINLATPAIRTYVLSYWNRFLIARNIIYEKQPLGSYFGRLLYAGIYCKPKKVYAFGGQSNKKYFADAQNINVNLWIKS